MDGQGNVYVADRGNSRVVKLAPGSNNQTVLAFTGLKNPDGVAVDPAGNVFVTDTDNNRVLELAAGAAPETVLPFTGVSVPWGIAVDNAGDRVRHRTRRQPGDEIGVRVQHPDRAAAGRAEHPVGRDGG